VNETVARLGATELDAARTVVREVLRLRARLPIGSVEQQVVVQQIVQQRDVVRRDRSEQRGLARDDLGFHIRRHELPEVEE
jgi:hypothetical protein